MGSYDLSDLEDLDFSAIKNCVSRFLRKFRMFCDEILQYNLHTGQRWDEY